ncbi:unnamed protein product [Cylindrotheca closterium]|uniref:Uncharacterized protein n=1 Tax=Cylindrotheca closterium TaxID=2856 RepID=A0AAD2FLS7_9STRA|nr:unnamed protein product [Cylindrotheca closterium]
MSNQTNGIFDMIHDEKNSKMDPEKWAAIHDPRAPRPQARANDDGRVMPSGMPERKMEPQLSTTGAYRVGDTESDDGGQTTSGDSDDDSESCFMVVPKAALVDDEENDGVMKDVEAPSTKISIVKARTFPDALHSSPTKKKSTHKRKFRCCMILFCLLLVGLLGGVFYFLCKDEFSTSTASLEATNGNGNGSGNGNSDDNDNNDGRRPSKGGGNGNGDGDGGNGRGNDND